MNLTELQNRILELYKLVCKNGEVPPPMRRELAELDKRAEKLMNTSADNSEWKLCFDMRETVAEILNSEAALFS
jgi:hypothetical protein